jgi:hypothetical protein
MTDPFAAPAPIASEFASADSFRGRLVLIEPTGLELDVPNQTDPSKKADRLTATVTTVDGQGPVQIFSQKQPTGKFLDGPAHKGVWFSQDRIVKGVIGDSRSLVGKGMVLARLETYKPGKGAGIGNPWGLVDPTDADKQLARDFLANRTVAAASAPATVAEDDNPFNKGDAPF